MLKVIARDASEAAARENAADRGSLTARKLLAAALVLAMLAAVALSVDLSVAHYVKSHGVPGELRRLVRLAEVFGWGGTVTLLILTAAMIDARGWRVLLPLAASSLGAGLIADAVKLLIARLRPSAAGDSASVLETFVGWLPMWHASERSLSGHAIQSFPSAHSATAAGLAAALGMLYPRGRWLFAFFALLAMLQRIEAQAHFCSDVLAGAAVGCCVAAVVATVQSTRFKVQN